MRRTQKKVKRRTKLVKRKQKVSRKRLTKNRQHRGGGYAETGHAGDRADPDGSRGDYTGPVRIGYSVEERQERQQENKILLSRKKEGDPCPSDKLLANGEDCKKHHVNQMGKGCNDWAYKVDGDNEQYAFCRNPSTLGTVKVLITGLKCSPVGAHLRTKKLCKKLKK